MVHGIPINLATPVARRKTGLGRPMNQLLAAPSVANQSLDRQDRQIKLSGYFQKPLAAGSTSPLKNFAQHPGRLQARQAAKIDRSLGVPRASEHAPLLGHQRKHMARLHKIRRTRSRVHHRTHGHRPLLGRNSRATTGVIHRDRERGLMR